MKLFLELLEDRTTPVSITQSAFFSGTAGWTSSLPFAKFDATLGSLTHVHVTEVASMSTTDPAVTESLSVNAQLPNGRTSSVNLVGNYSGSGSSQSDFFQPSDLAPFTSDYSVQASANTPLPSGPTSGTTTAGIYITITYDYTPPPPPGDPYATKPANVTSGIFVDDVTHTLAIQGSDDSDFASIQTFTLNGVPTLHVTMSTRNSSGVVIASYIMDVAASRVQHVNMFGYAGNDTLSNSNTAIPTHAEGGNGADLIYGSTGGDVLNGGAGTDTIYGDGGPDSINGGPDVDTLYGTIGFTIDPGDTGKNFINYVYPA